MRLESILLVTLVILVLSRIAVRLAEWFRNAPVDPDPWDKSVAEHLDDADCLPVCHRWLTPQNHDGWYCPECGSVVGQYANYLPYVYLFSVGEVFRNGVQHRLQRSPLVKLGYLLISVSEYVVFAPLYWHRFFTNLRRCKRSEEQMAEP